MPCELNTDTTEKISPLATATPGTARTLASVASLIGAVCTAAFAPSPWWGTTTTERPFAPLAKIDANDWSMVSVRM